MSTWLAIKRTPVDAAGWMLVGAAIFPAIGLVDGTYTVWLAVVDTIAGCGIAIVLRAMIVSRLWRGDGPAT